MQTLNSKFKQHSIFPVQVFKKVLETAFSQF